MPSFILPPLPCVTDPHYVVGPSNLTSDQLDALVQLGDRLVSESGYNAQVGGAPTETTTAPTIRRSKIAWIQPEPGTAWIFRHVGGMLQSANAATWGFNLEHITDALQYTTYLEEQQGHYDWHMDKFEGSNRPQRKLAGVILLSDPKDFEGGAFQIHDGRVLDVPLLNRGDAVVLPSYVLHRVTPVTHGVRKTLVVWATGPRFV